MKLQKPLRTWSFVLLLLLGTAGAGAAQTAPAPQVPPTGVETPSGEVTALYQALRGANLDPSRIFHVREALIEREDLHLWLTDGTVVFTKEVDGKTTGMFFAGEGELLVRPPNRTERESLGLFAGIGILEDKFSTAYFRFNDDTAEALKPFLRPPGDVDPAVLSKVDAASGILADVDALRLLLTFTSAPGTDRNGRPLVPDRFLHARVSGDAFGAYDVVYDSRSVEQIYIGQASGTEDGLFYDLWMAFATRKVREQRTEGAPPLAPAEMVRATDVRINATVIPPQELQADTELDLSIEYGGARVLLFELSRNLRVSKVLLDERPLEVIQNYGVPGSELARRGNDYIAVVLPKPCRAGERLHLKFSYAGPVITDAGNGLFYVGARGNWYPNRGLGLANYDLRFTYPRRYTLVATGKRVEERTQGESRIVRWTSEKPYTVAGFNLGEYDVQRTQWKDTRIDTYVAQGMEQGFPGTRRVETRRSRDPWRSLPEYDVTPFTYNPKLGADHVAAGAADAVAFFSEKLGPYPFSSLELTQMPGRNSQGWPGLIFLSSYSYLDEDERNRLHMTEFQSAFYGRLMLPHEIAHQWWGHQVYWKSYRDQWISEALANYSALLMLEQQDKPAMQAILEGYREQLLSETDQKRKYFEAGPVTLGTRLNSGKFPDAYDVIAYGRGAWLFHMLRSMLNDQDSRPKTKRAAGATIDVFVGVLQKLVKRHRDSAMTTEDLRRAFEEDLPESLRFEGKKTLDWFFDSWVNGTVIPRYELHATRLLKHQSGTMATGRIDQKDAPEDLVSSIPVYAEDARGKLTFLGRVFAVGDETSFRLRAPADTKRLVLDPYRTILSRP